MVEVATDKSLGDQVDAYIPMLHRAEARIDGLVELIGDLLTLSRSEQVRDLAGAELLAVEPAILAGVEMQKERLAAREIVAKVSIESDLPRVLISADDLDMIVGNLIGNAVKYNRDGGTVAVQAGRDGEWVRIDVTRHGHRHRDGTPSRCVQRVLPREASRDPQPGREWAGTGHRQAARRARGRTAGVGQRRGQGLYLLGIPACVAGRREGFAPADPALRRTAGTPSSGFAHEQHLGRLGTLTRIL